MPDKRITGAAAALIYGLVLAFIPLFRELHFLSASLTATIGAFTAAWIAGGITFRNKPAAGLRELAGLFLLSALPAVPLLLGSLIRGCFSGDGLAYWILIPGPSVALGFAIGRYFSFISRNPRLFSILLLLFISIGLLLWELYNYPQVFFHNHVWGFWPGPIYDDVVELNASILFFRYITLAWAALLWLFPFFYTRKGIRMPVLLVALSLMLSYLNLGRSGIIHSEDFIRQSLGGIHESRHAIIIHDRSITPERAAWLGMLHDFHIEELAGILELDLNELPVVRSYIYRHEWQKKMLTGAGNTVYVPVWNRNPQMHIHHDAVLPILRHELVHVLAREFGMPLLNASPNVALVEGLAVALQGERNPSVSLHQIVASQDSLPDAGRMASLMSPTGFYRLSGPLSYTLAGSFSAWLLDEYDVETFRRAYASGSIPRAYGKPIEELVSGWHSFLRTVDTDPAQLIISDRIFDAPGITELSCVFHPNPAWRVQQRSGLLISESREREAFELLQDFIGDTDLSSVPHSIVRRWGETGLRLGETITLSGKLQVYYEKSDVFPWALRLLLADAHFIANEVESGKHLLAETEHTGHPTATIRLDDELRDTFLQLEYGHFPVDSNLNELPAELIPYLVRYCLRFDEARLCHYLPPWRADLANPRYYQVYEAFILRLIEYNEYDNAHLWLDTFNHSLEPDPANSSKHNRLNQLERIKRFARFY